MLFDTTIPKIQNYTNTPTAKFGGTDKTIMSLLGYNDEGNRNTWGKIMPFTPFGGAATIGGNFLAHKMVSDDSQQLQDNVAQANQEKMKAALAMLQIGAGVGATAFGAPQAGVPLITSGAGSAVQSFGEGGILPSGSHKSGNDLALVHSKTGEDTDIRLEGGELLFSKENTEELKEAIKNNDHKKMLKIVKSQMKGGKHKMDNKKMELGEGRGWSGIPNVQQDSNPYAFGDYFGKEQNGQPVFDKYTPTSVQPYVFEGQKAPFSYANPDFSVAQGDTSNPYTFSEDWSGADVINGKGMDATIPTSGNSMGDYWSYIPGIAQTAIGLSNVNKKIPTITEPAAYSKYISRLAQMSNQGYTPEEKAYLNRGIQGSYDLGMNKAVNYSGGNSAAVLGTLNSLGNSMNEAKLKMAAEESGLKRQNLLNYGNALGTETQMFNLPNQEWAMKYALMNKEAAANLARTGLENVQSAGQYNKLYNSPEYLALLQAYKNKAAQ
jgi:hypothetical protein